MLSDIFFDFPESLCNSMLKNLEALAFQYAVPIRFPAKGLNGYVCFHTLYWLSGRIVSALLSSRLQTIKNLNLPFASDL